MISVGRERLSRSHRPTRERPAGPAIPAHGGLTPVTERLQVLDCGSRLRGLLVRAGVWVLICEHRGESVGLFGGVGEGRRQVVCLRGGVAE
jgi:hypothetical protein